MSLVFRWDPAKAASNAAKHGVSFEQALTVFGDPLARIFEDFEHSGGERREIIVGHASDTRLLVVCFIEMSGFVRILSSRVATGRERRDYEEKVFP